jgi:peptidoglycan hydrolase-like protein with peptidoglycan-binding domain
MLLKNGSKGEDVKTLQTKLGLTADGAFGPGTEKKVKEWQSANG